MPSREGLSGGETAVGRRACDTCECGSRTLDDDLCFPPLLPHGAESQTTCGHYLHPAFAGETRPGTEWVGGACPEQAALGWMWGQIRAPCPAEGSVGEGGGSASTAPALLHPHHPSNRFLKFQMLPAPITTPPSPSRAAAGLGDTWLDLLSNWYDRIPTIKVFTTLSVNCWESHVPSR